MRYVSLVERIVEERVWNGHRAGNKGRAWKIWQKNKRRALNKRRASKGPDHLGPRLGLFWQISGVFRFFQVLPLK
jgi:hypothetical protein